MPRPRGRVLCRSDAKAAVQGQLDRLNVIRGTYAREQEGVINRQLAYRRWWDDTRAMLVREFEDAAVAEQVLSSPPSFLSSDIAIEFQFRAVNDQIDGSHDRLSMLWQEIDQMPEVAQPSVAPPPSAVRLEPEQDELLVQLVEAKRRLSGDIRGSFLLVQAINGDAILHGGLPGWRLACTAGDLRLMAHAGLLLLTGTQIDITSQGLSYHDDLKRRGEEPMEQMESCVVRYLETEGFKARHPSSYAKWAAASRRLWSREAAEHLTGIGHDIREALQLFADELVRAHKPPAASNNPARTMDRIRAVLDLRQDEIGETSSAVLRAQAAALGANLTYWGAVSDLAQRQEHGAAKEGEEITWDDGRRLVFQAALVMYELDIALVPARQE